jgi:hypothetical protein
VPRPTSQRSKAAACCAQIVPGSARSAGVGLACPASRSAGGAEATVTAAAERVTSADGSTDFSTTFGAAGSAETGTAGDARTAGAKNRSPGAAATRCALERLVESILGPPLPGPLDALRSAIETTRTPQATLRWLTNERTIEILAAASSTRLSHETLDSFGTGPAVEHLRAMFVAADLLTVDVRPLSRLEAAAAKLVSGVDGADGAVIRGWVNWSVLPRVRRRAEKGKDITNSAANARRSLVHVTRLVATLHARARTLPTCTQCDLDAWFTQPGVAHHAVRPFLAWAQRRKHLPGGLIVPVGRRQGVSQLADPEERWTLARRLVVDDRLDPAD